MSLLPFPEARFTLAKAGRMTNWLRFNVMRPKFVSYDQMSDHNQVWKAPFKSMQSSGLTSTVVSSWSPVWNGPDSTVHMVSLCYYLFAIIVVIMNKWMYGAFTIKTVEFCGFWIFFSVVVKIWDQQDEIAPGPVRERPSLHPQESEGEGDNVEMVLLHISQCWDEGNLQCTLNSFTDFIACILWQH